MHTNHDDQSKRVVSEPNIRIEDSLKKIAKRDNFTMLPTSIETLNIGEAYRFNLQVTEPDKETEGRIQNNQIYVIEGNGFEIKSFLTAVHADLISKAVVEFAKGSVALKFFAEVFDADSPNKETPRIVYSEIADFNVLEGMNFPKS